MNDKTYEDAKTLTAMADTRRWKHIEMRHQEVYPHLYWRQHHANDEPPNPELSMVAAVERMNETRRNWQRIADREGCCGGDPHGDGFCWNIRGFCPRIEEAASAVRFCEALLEYLDLLNIEVQPEEACQLQ